MNKKIALTLLISVSLLLFCSCNELGGINGEGGIRMSEGQKADKRIEEIVAALEVKDSEALKSVFSKKALDETEDIDSEIAYLFDLIEGDVVSWERDGMSSSASINYGKKTEMIRFVFYLKTDKDEYVFYIIDYSIDTVDPDNQGVYMVELVKFIDEKDQIAWQDRMRPGVYIH